MKQKQTEWWKPTAKHMWRTYFAVIRDNKDVASLPVPDQKMFRICDALFNSEFVKPDQDILRTYFSARWGDDLYVVEDYSLRHNIPTKVIWIVINKANRMAMEETGLLERKDGANKDACD